MNETESHVLTEVTGGIARLTLNRPKALNALSLDMIRAIATALNTWATNEHVTHVLMRGMKWDKTSQAALPFGAFCAGGDIRYFHEAVHSKPSDALNRASLEDFFTEEYRLNHLIHHYPKPVVAFMDGVVMGGGMGLSQGASVRIVTERTKMAMPETAIGLFPDVGGGYFLSRCANSKPGVGEYLALTGQLLSGQEAVSLGLADVLVPSSDLGGIWNDPAEIFARIEGAASAFSNPNIAHPDIDAMQKNFDHPSVQVIRQSLESDSSDWAQKSLNQLQKSSPLMLAVSLEQIRRARSMSLADDLRMERDMVYHCFEGTPARQSDTVEGIRALVIDKDHSPRWQDVGSFGAQQEEVRRYFVSPWAAAQHPLAALTK